MQRAKGQVRLSVAQRGGNSHLAGHFQKGSFKALFPRSNSPHFDAVLLNTAGGIADGDRFSAVLDIQEDAHLTVTSQAAERIYKAQSQAIGQIDITAKAERGARLDWLPQETILFDRARLKRRLTVTLEHDAELLCVEPLVFGRTTMGETVQNAFLSDIWRVERDGSLIFADALKLEGEVERLLQRPAIASGNRAIASVLLISKNADAKLDQIRALLGRTGGASNIRPGVLFARLMAPDSFDLRNTLIPILEHLSGAPIPKTWRL